MEKYLIEQYDVYEDKNWLTSEDEIADAFMDIGREFLECGQGYYQDEESIICKIGDKFYQVDIYAEIMSAKQDVGDRLYWVEDIEKVEYKEIAKPQPKDTEFVTYKLELTESQKNKLEDFMKENHIEFN